MGQCIRLAHIARLIPNDDRKFALPVELLGQRRIVLNRLTRANDSSPRFTEEHGPCWELLGGVKRATGLLDVFDVVETDANDLTWA